VRSAPPFSCTVGVHTLMGNSPENKCASLTSPPGSPPGKCRYTRHCNLSTDNTLPPRQRPVPQGELVVYRCRAYLSNLAAARENVDRLRTMSLRRSTACRPDVAFRSPENSRFQVASSRTRAWERRAPARPFPAIFVHCWCAGAHGDSRRQDHCRLATAGRYVLPGGDSRTIRG